MESLDIAKTVIRLIWAEFTDHFDAAANAHYLYSRGIIDDSTMDVISNAKSKKDASQAFLSHLRSNATIESLVKLCTLLRDTVQDHPRHDSLAKSLEDDLKQRKIPLSSSARQSMAKGDSQPCSPQSTTSDLTDTIFSDEDAASRLGIVAALNLSEGTSQLTYTDAWLANDPPHRKIEVAFFRLYSCLAEIFNKHIDDLKPFLRACQRNEEWPYMLVEAKDIDDANRVQTIFNKIRIENCWLNTEIFIRLISVLPEKKSSEEAKQHLEVYHKQLGAFSKYVLLSHIPKDDASLKHFCSCMFPKLRVVYDVNIEDFDVSKLLKEQKFLSKIFKIPKEAFHYLEAKPTNSTLVTWALAISIEYDFKFFARVGHQFWSLKEHLIIKIEIDLEKIECIFQFHLKGKNLPYQITKALQGNQELLACTEQVSHQFLALVDYSHPKKKDTESLLQRLPLNVAKSEADVQEPALLADGTKMSSTRSWLRVEGLNMLVSILWSNDQEGMTSILKNNGFDVKIVDLKWDDKDLKESADVEIEGVARRNGESFSGPLKIEVRNQMVTISSIEAPLSQPSKNLPIPRAARSCGSGIPTSSRPVKYATLPQESSFSFSEMYHRESSPASQEHLSNADGEVSHVLPHSIHGRRRSCSDSTWDSRESASELSSLSTLVSCYAPSSMQTQTLETLLHSIAPTTLRSSLPGTSFPSTINQSIPFQSCSHYSTLSVQPSSLLAEPSRTIKVDNVPKHFDEEKLQKIFGIGFGPIIPGGIQLKGTSAYVTYQDHQVAAKVCAKQAVYAGTTCLPVSLSENRADSRVGTTRTSPAFDLKRTFVVQNVSADMTDIHLETSIRLGSRLEENDTFTVDRRGEVAVVKLDHAYNKESRQRIVDRITKKTKLSAHLLEDRTVLVEGVCENCKREGSAFFKRYFSRYAKARGYQAPEVHVSTDGQVIVTFETRDAAHRCCKHKHSDLGPNVQLSIHYPSLKDWMNTPERDAARRQALRFPLSHNLCSFISEPQQYGAKSLLAEFSQSRLSHLHAEAGVEHHPESCLVVSSNSDTPSSQLTGWVDKCRPVVESFLDQFCETLTPWYADVNKEITALLQSTNSSPGVGHNISTDVNYVVLFGYKKTVSVLLGQIKDCVYANHYDMEEYSQSISTAKLAYIDQYKPKELGTSPVQYRISGDAIVVSRGTARDREEFSRALDSLPLASAVIHHSPVKHCLLLTKSGRSIFSGLVADEGLRAIYVPDTRESICLVASDDSALKAARRLLENAISVHSMPVPHCFLEWSVSQEWLLFRDNVESRFSVVIQADKMENKVHVLYHSSSLVTNPAEVEVLRVVESYIHTKCDNKSVVTLESKQWKCLRRSKQWDSLISKLLQRLTKVKVPDLDDLEPRIELQGDEDCVREVKDKIITVCKPFCKHEGTVDIPGAAKFISLQQGKKLLERIELEYNTVIEYTVDSEDFLSVQVQELAGYTQAKTCNCCDVTKNCKLFLKVGELADYPGAEAVVNSTDESLRLTSQLAVDFATLNGKGFQAECASYLTRYNIFGQGKIVKFYYKQKPHPKAIVLVVLKPISKDTDGEEQRICRAVENCLQAAEGHSGITFPLLGTADNDRDMATISSEGMLKGISNYFKQHPQSSLKTVEILLPVDTIHVITIVASLTSLFGNVMAMIRGQARLRDAGRRPSRRNKPKPDLVILHSTKRGQVNFEVVMGDPRKCNSAGITVLRHTGQRPQSHVDHVKENGKTLFLAPMPTTCRDCSTIVHRVLQEAEMLEIRSLAIVNKLPPDLPWDSRAAIQTGIDEFIFGSEHKNVDTIREFVEMDNTAYSITEKRTKVKVHISSLDPQHAKQALAELEEKISHECQRKRKDNQTISCGLEMKLKTEASKRDALITVSPSERSVTFAGYKEDIEALVKIMEDAIVIQDSKVQWQWKDDSNKYQNYSEYDSDNIESDNKAGSPFHMGGGEKIFFIDFDKMTEQRNRSFTLVRRLDLESQGDIPPHWDHMASTDAYRCFPLERESDMFKRIAMKFQSTVPCTSPAAAKYDRIVEIERVQNTELWKQFQREGKDRNVETKELFFGCSAGNVQQQVSLGKFVRTNKKGLGNGVYFSKNGSDVCTQALAPKDNNGTQHIFLCQVITGDFTKGQNGLTEPPAKNAQDARGLGRERYDSVVDRVDEPTQYMVFRDAQVYPEYHIQYSTTPAPPQ